MNNVKQIHLIIAGRVQGVGFRAWTKKRALELNLSGWVKNLSDGRVEVFIAGEAEEIEKMLLLFRSGPKMAAVEMVEILNETLNSSVNDAPGFDIL